MRIRAVWIEDKSIKSHGSSILIYKISKWDAHNDVKMSSLIFSGELSMLKRLKKEQWSWFNLSSSQESLTLIINHLKWQCDYLEDFVLTAKEEFAVLPES